MPEIRGVTIQPVLLPEIRGIPATGALPSAPPITLELGVPIIEMPGCVASHPDARLNPNLIEADSNRTGAFCRDGEVPSFRPTDISPNTAEPIKAGVPRVLPRFGEIEVEEGTEGGNEEGSEDTGAVGVPGLPSLLGPKRPAVIQLQEERGSYEESFLEKAIDGLPPVEAVVTTTTIALVAATAALVAKPFSDLILKLIKPTVKKVVKKVSQARGKPVHVDSVWERRLAQRDRNRALRALRRALKP